MKQYLVPTLRILFGVDYLINGLDWWLHFAPMPPRPAHAGAADIVRALIESGFMFDLVKLVEVATGLACLTNLCVPLALVAALPITVVVVAVDVVMMHSAEGLFMGGEAGVLNVFLLFAYLKYYRPMLTIRTTPGCAAA